MGRAGGAAVVLLLLGCTGVPLRPSDLAATPAVVHATPETAVPSQYPEIPHAALSGLDLEVATDVVETALEFERTRAVHEGREYRVASVALREPPDFGYEGSYAFVLIELEEPIPIDQSRWPDEPVCAIGVRSTDVTGIAWLVSFRTGKVEAYSPQWDYAIDCV